MTKIYKIFLIILILTGCGFQRMDTVGGTNFYVENINFTGDKKSGYIIGNIIKPYSNSGGQNRINLDLNVKKEKVSKEKNISNKITKFSITMIVELQSDDLLKNTSKRKTFSHTLDFDVAKNHSKTIAKERSIIVNISEIIGEQVIRYLRSEYR